jgi:hypothetical protein
MEMSERFSSFRESEPVWTPGAESPGATFTHPADVVSDPGLTMAEKKAILASWSSDARAVENSPALRRLDSGAIVEVDAILRALASLEEPSSTPWQAPKWTPLPRPRSVIARWRSRTGRRYSIDDNDDDPPPAPAGIAIPFRPTFVAAHGRWPESLQGSACATG